MIIRSIKILCFLFFTINILVVNAQYFPVIDQYLNNGLPLNPAYSGSREVLSADAMLRRQWVGIQGSPIYNMLSVHSPLSNKKVGVGLLLFNEQIGIYKQSQVYFNYAYRIYLRKGILSLGLRAGMHYVNADWSNIETVVPDPTFLNSKINTFIPNVGLGIYYYTSRFYFGTSIPYMLSLSSVNGEKSRLKSDISNYNYLIYSGVLIDVGQIKLKPSVLLRYNTKTKQQFDVALTAYFVEDMFGLGLGYRSTDAVSILAELRLIKQLRFGYAFDLPTGELSAFSRGSHEVFIRYEFAYKVKAISARYF